MDSDGVDVVTPSVSVAKERPHKNSNKRSYSWFDPGEGDSTIFELPTEEMVEYITKKFTAYISEWKLKETMEEDYPLPYGVPGLHVPCEDDYISEIF